jgi:hypothetical protein
MPRPGYFRAFAIKNDLLALQIAGAMAGFAPGWRMIGVGTEE